MKFHYKPKMSSAKTVVTKKVAPKVKPVKKVSVVKAKADEKVDTEVDTEKKERKRREVTKETVDADFSVLQTRIESEIARLRESSEKVRGIKFLRSINKALKTLHSDTKRVMKLKKKNNRKKNVVSGFLKPIKISPELAAFTSWDVNGTYSRVNVTKFICDYIKNNGLYNEEDKRLIICDDRLKDLLSYDPENPPVDAEGKPAPLNYFRLQKYLKPHFIKIEVPKEEVKAETVKKAPVKATAKTTVKAVKKAPKKAAVPVEEEDDEEELDE